VPITSPVELETHSSPREAKLHHFTRNRELLVMAKSKDMSVVLILTKLSNTKKILHLDKIKYLFICQDIRGKSAISRNKKLTNNSLAVRPRHPPMILVPMVAIPTSKIRKLPKISALHSLPEHQRVTTLTPMSSITTATETTCLLSPGKQHTTPLISATTSQATQLRPPAPKRRDSPTKRIDLNSTKKSRR
jgi:hypothetical protein